MKKPQLSENALQIAESRYFLNGETWETCTERVADAVAHPEPSKQKYKEKFHEMIHEMFFIPGGRIMRNSHRARGSMFNCYHLPIGDSIEEIGQFYKDALILWSEGGGVGCNFTSLRPEGSDILGKGGQSSGLVSFMVVADFISKVIESGGERRAAAIGHIDVTHPEIMNFIDAKLIKPDVGSWLREDTPKEIIKFVKEKVDIGALSHFNISVVVNNDFLEAAETNSSWDFQFKQKKYGTIQARDLWDKIVNNMVNCAEPGLINWSNFSKNNSWYFEPVLGSNPCGEAILGPYGVCDLGSLVLPNFITGTVNTNWVKLEQTIDLAVRFLDNVIDINKYTLKEIDISAHSSRRIGLGVLGVAEYLFAKKIRYGSEKAVVEIERLMRFIRDAAYKASIRLATEKGSFPKFDPVLFGKSSFIRKLPAMMRTDIKKHGVRNTTLMAIAPTGTISLLADYTSGIEPLFAKAYIRKDRVGERVYVHPKYKDLMDSDGKKIPDWLVDAFDLSPEDHFEIQCAVQKYVDGGVSKTINLPKDTKPEELSKLLLEYVYDLKGVTVYRDGSREGQILNSIPHQEALKRYKNKTQIDIHPSMEDVACSTSGCEV